MLPCIEILKCDDITFTNAYVFLLLLAHAILDAHLIIPEVLTSSYAYSLFLIHALTYCNIHTHRVIIAHVYTSYIQGHSYILKDRTSNGILTLTISYDILTQEEEEGAITPIG